MSSLKGKAAIVTGGSRGIGREIVKMLANEGCNVAFSYLKSKDEALKLESEIKKTGADCIATCIDVQDFEKVKSWIEEVKGKFGQLDILINNAGVIVDKALMMMTHQDWEKVINTDLNGVFNVTRNCIVTFMKKRSGNIINISSISGVIGLARQTNYSAAKGGVNAFTKSLAKEVAAHNIRVNAIAPGFIETDILSGLSEEQRKDILQSVPLGRIGSVEDVANCVKFLLSEAAQYITGQVIQVDGGLAMK